MASTHSSPILAGKPGKNGKRKTQRPNRESEDGRTPDGDPATTVREVAGVAEASRQPRAKNHRRPVKVGAGQAGARIRGLADVSESLDVRRRLRRLARQIERGSKDVQRMSFIEAAVGECLDEAAVASERERWLLCEAATWGLAWMARTRRAGGSAGSLLERLAKAARSAQQSLAAGDTLSARFVLAVARLFADIEACRCLEAAAAEALEKEIGDLVSPEGVVRLRGSTAMVGRLVRWCSVRDVGLATGRQPWNDATEARFDAAVAAGLRLLGRGGRMLAGAGRMPAACTDPLLATAAAARRKRVRRSAEAVQNAAVAGGTSRKKTGRKRAGDAAGKLLDRDQHEAGVAVLRAGWQGDAIRVLIDYRDAVPHLEIAVGDRLLVEGPWRWRVAADGRPLAIQGPWTLSCWESDRKATFLEIVAPLADGLQLDRQIVLLPRDRVVLLSDAVTHRGAAEAGQDVAVEATPPRPAAVDELQVEAVVPLAASLEAEQSDETREIFVYDTRARFVALPLSLPEWKAAGRGRFEAAAEGLVLEHRGAGSRCCMPLWLDLEPGRQGKPLTWRQLTVADTRRNLPPHQAVGFRVQHGLEQWLVYRTLDEPRNRTLLGCNVSCDFLVGAVGGDGVVDRTIEIQ